MIFRYGFQLKFLKLTFPHQTVVLVGLEYAYSTAMHARNRKAFKEVRVRLL